MAPGDEVICVGTSPMCPHCDNRPILEGGFFMPEIGAHYVAALVGVGYCSKCEGALPVMRPAGTRLPRPWAWGQHWFRPLEYDEDESIVVAGVTLPVLVPA